MNIEKLAKRLKEFTLDDIELIAECDCKIKLEQLLNSNKILFENGIYKYNEETETGENYEIFSPLKNKHLKISIEYRRCKRIFYEKLCRKILQIRDL